jgi:predicted nucleic acid-binding protein
MEGRSHGRITGKHCDTAIPSLEELGLTTVSSRPLLRSAVAIALAFNRSVYDSTYVALAVESNVPLITADERLVNALSARFPVRWLGAASL